MTPPKSQQHSTGPWPSLMIAMMIVGYAGYYLCRSDLSVARSLIVDQYGSVGVTKETIGGFTALATALYALGKFIFGSASDVLGGRRMFLAGMIGSVLFTVLFGIGGPPIFLFAWCGNKFIQSTGWVGMVKLTSKWFPHNSYGSVMGLISLSYLFGDFLSRLFLGKLISAHFTWQQIFYISASVLAVLAIPAWWIIRNSPLDRGLPEPDANPESVFADEDDSEQKLKLSELLRPLFASKAFWTACVLSVGFTFMRETFNDWIPTYLHEVAKMSEGDAASASSLFPLFGGISVLGLGYLSDKLPKGGRAAMIAIGLGLSTLGLLALGFIDFGNQAAIYVAMTALIAFILIGPYSFLGGAVSLDFGGKQASASAVGWIDGTGYVGGILSGYLISKVAERQGWSAAFQILALTAFLSFIVALIYWRSEVKRPVTASQ